MPEFNGLYVSGRSADNRSLDVNSALAGAPIRVLTDVLLTADLAQNDTINLGSLPARAVPIASLGNYQTTALGTSVTMSIGFADDARPEVKAASSNGAGIASKTAALLSAANVASAGSGNALAAVALADRGKPLWALAGLTRDPGVTLKLIATLAGANPDSGSVAWTIPYTIDGQ